MVSSSWIAPPPPDPETLKNPPPFAPFNLQQLLSGKIKKALANGRIESAIYKKPLSGPVEIKKNGIVGDQRAYEPHRGPDKALLHYCSSHYDEWKKELPNSADLFKPGGFGENLFSEQVSEKTLCIGDRIAIGNIIVEVSEARAPCYKLNHRFEMKDMARRTQTLFRTGWLYRIIKPGFVQAGDVIKLLERPNPEWTLARVMYYLYIETGNAEMMKQIIELEHLGVEVKDKFRARLAKGATEDQNGRMYGADDERMDTWLDYRILEKKQETSKIIAFTFEAIESIENPVPVEPGSHVRLKLGGKLVRAYSVISGTSECFKLGIALDPNTRGGSKYLHEQAKIGDVLTIGRITASFPLAKNADEHIVIAGGIGITAFLTALEYLQRSKHTFHLHYAVADEVPFSAHIRSLGPNATIYRRSQNQRMDLAAILSHVSNRSHIYTCGPPRLMDAVCVTAKKHRIPDPSVHLEQFTVTTSGDPFTAELKQSDKIVNVGPTESLLDALRAVGMDVGSSCEVGNCGTCKVDVCEGRVEHRGTALLDEEKCASMLSCVSRGVGTIVLDL